MLRNFIQICSEGLRMEGTARLIIYLVIAFVLSGFVWWACTHYTKLWNKVYHVTPSFHVLCGIAALVTFFSTLGFIGLKNMKPVAEQWVAQWAADVMDDYDLSNRCFKEAFYAIRYAGIEDMRGFRSPENGGDLIPISSNKTQVLVGEIYAGNACLDFTLRNPFIGHFLKADDGVPSEIIAADVNRFFKTNRGETYPLEQGFVLAIDQISSDLQSQCGRIVRVSRFWLVLIFLLVQLIPFGTIGYLAYKDLKNNRKTDRESYHDDFDFDNI